MYFIPALVVALLTNIQPFLHHPSTTISEANSGYNYSAFTIDENMLSGWRLSQGISFAIGRHGGAFILGRHGRAFILKKQTGFVLLI